MKLYIRGDQIAAITHFIESTVGRDATMNLKIHSIPVPRLCIECISSACFLKIDEAGGVVANVNELGWGKGVTIKLDHILNDVITYKDHHKNLDRNQFYCELDKLRRLNGENWYEFNIKQGDDVSTSPLGKYDNNIYREGENPYPKDLFPLLYSQPVPTLEQYL